MGANNSKLTYITLAKNDIDREIRIFECSELLNIDKTENERSFNSIYSEICFDSEFFQSENTANLDAFLKENFNEKITNLVIKNEYFKMKYENTTVFDIKKIRLLIFLLTFNTNDKTTSKKNPDKVILFNYIFKFIFNENIYKFILIFS